MPARPGARPRDQDGRVAASYYAAGGGLDSASPPPRAALLWTPDDTIAATASGDAEIRDSGDVPAPSEALRQP